MLVIKTDFKNQLNIPDECSTYGYVINFVRGLCKGEKYRCVISGDGITLDFHDTHIFEMFCFHISLNTNIDFKEIKDD
jgi:hypothetical protein